jgi:hypothetical protein
MPLPDALDWKRRRSPKFSSLRYGPSYSVGDKIGPWPIFFIGDNEIVAGRNNKHLNFRPSVLRLRDGDAESVVVSTICSVHNLSGKIYLFFIVPFHRAGVQSLLANAVAAKRL